MLLIVWTPHHNRTTNLDNLHTECVPKTRIQGKQADMNRIDSRPTAKGQTIKGILTAGSGEVQDIGCIVYNQAP